MIAIRPGTSDTLIRRMILEDNEYRLPTKFDSNSIILDIGGHIGVFTHAVLDRGAGYICCIEADLENYCIAQANLYQAIEQGQVRLIHGAAWRSDANEDVLYQGSYTIEKYLPVNTGAGTVLWNDKGNPVSKIAFDELVLELTENGTKRIRLLKLDCEGSEWPILFTSKILHLIDEICGEYHEIGGQYDTLTPPFEIEGYSRFTLDELTTFLEQQGFQVESTRHTRRKQPERLGLFFARR